MNWKLKSAVRSAVLAMPGGAAFYRTLTARILGTQHGMAAKWFRVFPAHVKVLQDHFGEHARNVPLWCFDSGATPAAGFAAALVSDEPGLLTDRWDRLTDVYLGTSRRILAGQGGELSRLARAPAARFSEVVAAVSAPRGSLGALRAVRMDYEKNHAAAVSPEWRGRLGLVFSAGTFEHYSPEQVRAEIAAMREALRPGGVLSHVVDHRDHRWHADKNIPPLLHLTMDEQTYLRRFSNPLDYHNRWTKSRWVEELERSGFEVSARTVIRATPDLVPLPAAQVDPEFRHLPADDFDSLVTHLVAVKRD